MLLSFKMAAAKLVSVNFEVFGKVQGVFFRKNTLKFCVQKKLVGWVKNTSRGTVVGVAQGEADKISEVKHWLRHVGSPKSRIDRCEFTEEREIQDTEYTDFTIVKK